jgi:hypothetical protein
LKYGEQVGVEGVVVLTNMKKGVEGVVEHTIVLNYL